MDRNSRVWADAHEIKVSATDQAPKAEYQMKLDCVWRDTRLAVVEVEEGDPR